MNASEVQRLIKKYKHKLAVNDLTMTVRKGELFALLGVDGAGKTTMIKMLSCVLHLTSEMYYCMVKVSFLIVR